MFTLPPEQYSTVRDLFLPLDYHLNVRAILEGVVETTVYVDDLTHPQAALTSFKQHYMIAGDSHRKKFLEDVRGLFAEQIRRSLENKEEGLYQFSYPSEDWEAAVLNLFPGQEPAKAWREYYEYNTDACPRLPDWRQQVPEGFLLRPVDGDLLAQEQLKNLDDLKEEMCSERASVEEFLEKSFGICILHAGELAGWCLSEYNRPGRCEIGIATDSPYRRRGLATLMTQAFIELALERGVQQVGWHCWSTNRPSSATARKAGLKLICQYPALIGCYDPVKNLALHAEIYFNRADYGQALAWFEQAFAQGEGRGWAYWEAACAYAHLNQPALAFNYLNRAWNQGFTHLEYIRSSEHLEPLHELDGWKQMMAEFEARNP